MLLTPSPSQSSTPFLEIHSQKGHPVLAPGDEGELSIDVFRTEHALIIRAPMAGVSLDDVELSLHADLLTIRGTRHQEEQINDDDWFARECYWGTFSRSIVLPLDVYQEQTQATLKQGLLEIRIPIKQQDFHIPIHLR